MEKLIKYKKKCDMQHFFFNSMTKKKCNLTMKNVELK